jgi:hypothetical protein
MKHIKLFEELEEFGADKHSVEWVEEIPARKLSDKFMKKGRGLADVISNTDKLSYIVDLAKQVKRYTYSEQPTPEFLKFIQEVDKAFPGAQELKSVEILNPGVKLPLIGRVNVFDNASNQIVSMNMYLCSLLKGDGSHKNFE